MTADQEPRDVEARLRASLHAYAEVVDDRPARRSPARTDAGGGPRSSTIRRWRGPALAAAAVLAVAGGAWVFTGNLGAPSPTAATGVEATVLGGDSRAESGSGAEAAPQPQPPAADAAAAAGPGGLLVVPPPAEVGVSYPFDLYTRCGVLGADVGGVWFGADPPLLDGPNGPPAGWDDPYQRGTLELVSAELAVFRDDAGHELYLRPAESERPPPCD